MSQTSISNRLEAREILSFPHAELQKNVNGENKISEVGMLSVFYFPFYHRFILYLNNWTYVLLKRLPITASSKSVTSSRCYILPSYNGYYVLKLRKIRHLEALTNLDTILSNNTTLTYMDQQMLTSGTGIQNPSRSSSLASSDQEENSPNSIGKLRGREMIKKGFKKIASKLSGQYTIDRRENKNLTRVLDYESLKHGLEASLICPIGVKDIESAIARQKEIARVRDYQNSSSVIRRDPRRSKIFNRVSSSSPQSILANSNYDIVISDSSKRSVPINPFILQSENWLFEEIEKERQLQQQERALQEEHRKKELEYVLEERKLLDEMRRQREEECIRRNQIVMSEIERKDLEIAEQARAREAERLELENNERRLQAQLEASLAQIRYNDEFVKDERIRFEERAIELIQKSQDLELMRKTLELKQGELMKTTQLLEREYETKVQLTESERVELKRKEMELQEEAGVIMKEIEEKEKIVAAQRFELLEKEEGIRRLTDLKRAELSEIEQSRLLAQEKMSKQLAEIREREKMLELERFNAEHKHAEIAEEVERRLAEFKEKEKLTEAEYREVVKREGELQQLLKEREQELLEITEKERILKEEAESRENEFRNQINMTEKEYQELEHIKGQLSKAAQLKEEEIRNLESRKNELMREVETRSAELLERERMTESELESVHLKEKQFQAELLARLRELMEKEKLTEEERLELKNRQKELVKLHELREIEIKQKFKPLDQLRQYESQLISQNMKVFEGHQVLNQELAVLAEELEEVSDDEIETQSNKVMSRMSTTAPERVRETPGRGDGENRELILQEPINESHLIHYEA